MVPTRIASPVKCASRRAEFISDGVATARGRFVSFGRPANVHALLQALLMVARNRKLPAGQKASTSEMTGMMSGKVPRGKPAAWW